MRRVLSLVAVVAAMSAASGANAWWCTGHMTVAAIAKQQMQQSTDGQTALTAVESIIASLSTDGPFPKIPTMIEAGCWADDVKKDLDMNMADWHFLNLPYNPTNYSPTVLKGQKETVDVVLRQMDGALKEHPIWWEKSFALANMLHFYGDVHQPLHVIELFSSTYPHGDRGGNLIDVTLNGTAMNLHAVWDSICGYYTSDPARPLDAAGLALVNGLATNFVQAHQGITPQEISVYNSTQMAVEGFNYAVQYAYDNQQVVQSGVALSTAYVNQCYYYATRRIALAGLRLASELTYLFKYGEKASPTAAKIHERVNKAKLEILLHAQAKHAQMRRAQGGKKAKNVQKKRLM